MTQEEMVCTLEQSMRLNELGIDLSSQFAWCWNGAMLTSEFEKAFFLNLEGFKEEWPEAYPAFTSSELGIMLPQTIKYRKTQVADIKISRFNAWTIFYNRRSSGMNVLMSESKNEAQARADMLIQLLENQFVTSEFINSQNH